LVGSGAFGKVHYVLVGDDVAPAEHRLTSLGAVAITLDPDTEPEMPPLPYPHRVSFLAPTMALPGELEHLALLPAKLFHAILFDHLIRHPIVSVGDFDEENLTDDQNRLIDARSPGAEDAIDWFFRVSRRHEVLWLDVSLDNAHPTPVKLRAHRPSGPVEEWTSDAGTMSEQIGQVLDLWLTARNLPAAGALIPFDRDDVLDAVGRIDRALLAGRAADGATPREIPETLLQPPSALAVAFYRVMENMAAFDGSWDQRILAIDPYHPAARRNQFLASLAQKDSDRRGILPIIEEAPMYGKPHLSVHGDAFAGDRPGEGMGLRHQGIAATLIPANPWACHNYAIHLKEDARIEESYRWCDRATIASPSFDNAHLDAVRRMRDTQRPGSAFAEAQYRCNDLLTRWNEGRISRFEWPAKYHAGMLLALVHHDIGRLDEAIRIAEHTMADLQDPEAGHESFGWAIERIQQWKSDPEPLARAYAWEGFHRGDPGRVLDGFARVGVAGSDDAWMMLDALTALGRDDLACVAFRQYLGQDCIGTGKGRLAGAKAEILAGDLDLAIENLQIVQLRRPQSRLEPEINRLLRLACCRRADEWDAVIAHRLDAGALTLARRAARDLADFVPGMTGAATLRALGPRRPWQVDPAWLASFADQLPKLAPAARAAIDERLAPPAEATLHAADVLAADWWRVVPPPNKDREAHAAAALYALAIALARYLATTSGRPTPIAGAYRHVATEALHLVRRGRFHVDDDGERALLELLEECVTAMPPEDEWLFDTWLLRVEHALELDTEYGAYLPALTAGLPRTRDLLRGDERIGWELRMAWDLRAEPGQLDAAGVLFERCARAMETGAAERAWSEVAATTLPPAQALDVHWIAALANPTNNATPWVNLARAQLAAGRSELALDALYRAFRPTAEVWRQKTILSFADAWRRAGIEIPFGFEEAQAAGLAALQKGDLARARRCLLWCQAQDPENGVIAKTLGIVYGAMGRVHECVEQMARFDARDAAKHAGTALLQAKNYTEAVLALRWAAAQGRLVGPDDWRLLAVAAWYAEDDAIAAMAYERMLGAGAEADLPTLQAFATALHGSGQWATCEQVARRQLDLAGADPTYRATALHALAKALAGQGRFADATRLAVEAQQINPLPENAAELAETVRLCQSQQAPPVKGSPETSVERQAFDALAAGDLKTPEQLATSGNSWGLFRAALTANEFRYESENHVPVNGRALEAAQMVLERTVGNSLPDACVCRIRALRLRENAFIQIDPPPPMGTRMRREELEVAFARRSADRGADVAATPSIDAGWTLREVQGAAATAGDPDPTVFPGQRVARLSEYVALMKGMQTGDMMGALSRAGLDMSSYQQVATQWGQKLAADATLHARFARMMQA